MNRRTNLHGIALAALLLAGCTRTSMPADADRVPAARPESTVASDGTAKPERAKIYDEEADGFEQIAAASIKAKKEGKRILLQFGADWCGWCHRLHNLCESDQEIANILAANFVVVHIDVDKGHNSAVDEKLGKPTEHGLPVLVVLDADGVQLTTKDTAELEEGDHHDPELVKAFLKEWAPRSRSATETASKTAGDSPS